MGVFMTGTGGCAPVGQVWAGTSRTGGDVLRWNVGVRCGVYLRQTSVGERGRVFVPPRFQKCWDAALNIIQTECSDVQNPLFN